MASQYFYYDLRGPPQSAHAHIPSLTSPLVTLPVSYFAPGILASLLEHVISIHILEFLYLLFPLPGSFTRYMHYLLLHLLQIFSQMVSSQYGLS